MYTIPDQTEGASNVQSIVFQDDLENAINSPYLGTFVKSGLAVTANAALSVAVAAGVCYSQGIRYPVAANAALMIAAADLTNPRIDMIVVTTAGVLAVRQGVAVAFTTTTTPKPLNLTLGDVALAQVFVAALDTALAAGDVVDKRLFVPNLSNFPVEVGLIDNFLQVFPTSGSSSPSPRGGAITTGGTVTHPALAVTDRRTQSWRTQLANIATTTNQILGITQNSAALKQFHRGTAAGRGGFYFRGKMWIGLMPAATIRYFNGMTSVNTGVVISNTLAGDTCGLWHDDTMAATVLNFITRDNVTTTSVAITLATAMAAGQGYELIMYCAPNSTVLFYKVVDMLTGLTLADSFTSTTLPRNTIFIGPELAMSNAANATVTTTASEIQECYVTSPAIRS